MASSGNGRLALLQSSHPSSARPSWRPVKSQFRTTRRCVHIPSDSLPGVGRPSVTWRDVNLTDWWPDCLPCRATWSVLAGLRFAVRGCWLALHAPHRTPSALHCAALRCTELHRTALLPRYWSTGHPAAVLMRWSFPADPLASLRKQGHPQGGRRPSEHCAVSWPATLWQRQHAALPNLDPDLALRH